MPDIRPREVGDMVIFLVVLGLFGVMLLLPMVIAFAGVLFAVAIVVGAFWLAFRLLASGIWWGMAIAVLLAFLCYFFWPVLLVI